MKGYLVMNTKEVNRISILQKLIKREIKTRVAARELSLSIRQVLRLKKKFKSEGAAGLIHKNRGKVSNHRIPTSIIDKVIKIIKERYYDFSPTLAWEKLNQNYGINISRETLRKAMIKADLWQPKKQRKLRLYQLRPRRDCEGELVQADGSPYCWFEDRGRECTLLVFIDDATGKLLHLEFVLSESTNSYFKACFTYFRTHGKPLAFYLDKHGVFRINTTKGGIADTHDSNGFNLAWP